MDLDDVPVHLIDTYHHYRSLLFLSRLRSGSLDPVGDLGLAGEVRDLHGCLRWDLHLRRQIVLLGVRDDH